MVKMCFITLNFILFYLKLIKPHIDIPTIHLKSNLKKKDELNCNINLNIN